MDKNSDLDSLRAACGIDCEKWHSLSADEHAELQKIFDDHSQSIQSLQNLASGLSTMLQGIPDVHSVRWRVKSPEHLIAKIVRKKASGVEKYKTVTVESYRGVVTDLVGLRVLHLFKTDLEKLHQAIIDNWDAVEPPTAYVRVGDTDELRDLYKAIGLVVEDHNDGYRSVHYIVRSSITKNSVLWELQVRTIFEEGWSEIDHRIRYPEFSNDETVAEFLKIFNRLSGAADEMGTFVSRLATSLTQLRMQQVAAEERSAAAEAKVEEQLMRLDGLAHQNGELKRVLQELRSGLADQKQVADRSGNLASLFSLAHDPELMKMRKRYEELILQSKAHQKHLSVAEALLPTLPKRRQKTENDDD